MLKHLLRSHVTLRNCTAPRPLTRAIFNVSGTWEKTLTNEYRKEIEKHWRLAVTTHHLKRELDHLEKDQDRNAAPYYNDYVLSMFPYPSGALHMGHVRVYTISDTMTRYRRAKGHRTLQPMGWDAFGLPAENAALDRDISPADWTHSNIKTMRAQLDQLGLALNWEREVTTCDASYYKWTQHIFLQLYHKGLIYQKNAYVNWDPVDKTVLADEQIDQQGRSWRSGAVAVKKLLTQWYIKTTQYSKSLLDGLDEVNSDLWRDVVDLQRNWIGKCDGTRLEFTLKDDSGVEIDRCSIFTKNAECLHGVAYILLAKGHHLNQHKYLKNTTKTDSSSKVYGDTLLTGTSPLLPGHVIRVLIASDTQVFNVDEGEHYVKLGIPNTNIEDKQIGDMFDIPFKEVLKGDTIINSCDEMNGLQRSKAFQVICNKAKELECGGYETSSIARDWSISRQRYWGTPIPMIHCHNCGTVPVPFEQLPVTLPDLDDIRTTSDKGHSPLENASAEWLHTECPKCNASAKRETDTMDTFFDSSWYYLRYLDPGNQKVPFSPEVTLHEDTPLPVSLYVGGKEHAIMHLYYARFVSHFLYNEGLLKQREPFKDLLTQGMVMGESYRSKATGKYLKKHEVRRDANDKVVEVMTGSEVTSQWEKMSKSKYNGMDPQEVLDTYGCDATRICILSGVAPKSDRKWSLQEFHGVTRWQNRVWSLITDYRELQQQQQDNSDSQQPTDEQIKLVEEEIFEFRNLFLKDINFHMDQSYLISTAISRLHGLTNSLMKIPLPLRRTREYERALGELLVMISPLAPHFTSELWSAFHTAANQIIWAENLFDQKWPIVDENYAMNLKVLLNDRPVFDVKLPMTIWKTESLLTEELARTVAESSADYSRFLGEESLRDNKLGDINSIRLTQQCGVRVDLYYETTLGKKRKKRHHKFLAKKATVAAAAAATG